MKIVKKWRSFRRARKQLLTVAQRRKRLQFAREQEHFSAQDWEDYIFSDESTKYLFHVPNRQDDTVWGSQSENVPDVSCVKSSARVRWVSVVCPTCILFQRERLWIQVII